MKRGRRGNLKKPKLPVVEKTVKSAKQLKESLKQGVVWQQTQDWEEMKEDFFTARDELGAYAYDTLQRFAKAQFGKRGIVNWPLTWFLKSVGDQEHPPLKWYGDWEQERMLSGRRFTKHLQGLKTKLEEEIDLAAMGRTLADSYLPLQQRVFDFWKEVEAHLRGKIILDSSAIDPSKGKTKKEQEALRKEKANIELNNMRRVKLFMTTTEWVVDIKTRLDNQFLKLLGWEKPQFLEIFERLRKEALKEGAGPVIDNSLNQLLGQLAMDQIQKAKMYELPLPEDIQHVAEKINGNGVKKAEEEEEEEEVNT